MSCPNAGRYVFGWHAELRDEDTVVRKHMYSTKVSTEKHG